MKQKLFTTVLSIISLFVISCSSFAQADSGGLDTGGGGSTGGSVDGGGTTTPGGTTFACPAVSFKRNNGNGTCLGYAQIRVVFPDQFTTGFVTPTITSITYQGQPVKYALPPDGIVGVPTTTGQGYVSYCLGSMSQFPGFNKELNNIPPAYKLQITFKYPNGTTANYCTVSEND